MRASRRTYLAYAHQEAAEHIQQHSKRTTGSKQQVPANVDDVVKQTLSTTFACAIQSFRQAHFHQCAVANLCSTYVTPGNMSAARSRWLAFLADDWTGHHVGRSGPPAILLLKSRKNATLIASTVMLASFTPPKADLLSAHVSHFCESHAGGEGAAPG